MKTLDNTRFILHKIFKSSEDTILNIVNWGDIDEQGKINYITKAGKQSKTKEEIQDPSTKVLTFNEINLKSSLYHWIKDNNAYNKDIVVDMGINKDYEVYKKYGWHLSLQIVNETNLVRVKPILT